MGLGDWFKGGPASPVPMELPRLSKEARVRIGAGLANTEPKWRSTMSRDLGRMLDRGVVEDPVFQHVARSMTIGHGLKLPTYKINDFPSLAVSPEVSDENLLLATVYAAQGVGDARPQYDETRSFHVSGAQLLSFVNEVLAADGFDLRVTETGYEPAVPPEREATPEDKFKTLKAYSELTVDFEVWSKDGEPMAFLFFDIDNFKSYNTRLTEGVVDDVLLGPLHRLVKKEVGSRGGAYAMGKGDEFGVLLRNVTPEEALMFATRLHAAIAAASFPNGDKVPEQITVSMGISCAPRDGTTIEGLKLKANAAEHDAKHEGGKKCIYEHGVGRVGG